MATDTGREVAVVEQQAVVQQAPPQAVTIFGTSDPKEISGKVVALAQFVEDIVTRGDLVSTIQGRRYVNVEGWEAAGVGIGLAAYIVSCEPTGPLDDNFNAPGFVAVAELRNQVGMVISRAESSCERDEPKWRDRNNYALRSMAQTRATGKVFRQVLGFVMTVAGYAGTPADDMPTDEATGAPRAARQPRAQSDRSGPPPAGAPARQAQAARSAAQQAQEPPRPAQQSTAAPSLDPGSIRTVKELLRRLEATYGYNEAQLLRVLNVPDLDGVRNLGIAKSLELVKLYYDTDARGGKPPVAAQASDAEDGDMPFGDEDALPGREAVLEGEVVV